MEYTEHEKLKAVADQSQAIGEFVDWLSWEKGIHLAEWEDTEAPRMYPTSVGIVRLLEEFFDIDGDRLEDEKRHMITQLQEANSGS